MKVAHSKEKERTTENADLVGRPLDVGKLLGEVVRYLDAVDLFRALGHEPTWRGEDASASPMRQRT